MKYSEFKELKVGDKVKVRSWEELKEEFGLDKVGDIRTPEASFVKGMSKFCGAVLEVGEIDKDETVRLVGCRYYFHRATIELVEKKVEQPKEVAHLESWLGSKLLERCGNIGEPTPLKDSKGEELNIGDLVMSKCESISDAFIAPVLRDDEKCFVFGLAAACKPDGKISGDLYIQKIAGYNEIPLGSKLHTAANINHYIKYCKGE